MILNYLKNIILFAFILSLASCDVVGDIFKAGMWFAVIAIAIVVGLVLFIISRLRR